MSKVLNKHNERGIILEDPPLPKCILKLIGVNIKKHILIVLFIITLISIGFIVYGQNRTGQSSAHESIIISNNIFKLIKKGYNLESHNIRLSSIMLVVYCGLFYYFKIYKIRKIGMKFIPVGIHDPPIRYVYFQLQSKNYFGGIIH